MPMAISVILSWSAPGLSHILGGAIASDDIDRLRIQAQTIERANQALRSWVESAGSIITMAGATGRAQISADRLADLPKMREQYGQTISTPLAVGIGMVLSEADRALKAAVQQGGDQILFYGPAVEEALKAQRTIDPLEQAALHKAQQVGYNEALRPVKPTAEASEHSQGEAMRSELEDQPPAPEATHAARDLEEHFHSLASNQRQADQGHDSQDEQRIDAIRQKVVSVLQTVRQQAPVLAQLRTQAPGVYESVQQAVEAVIAMAKELKTPTPLQKAEMPGIGYRGRYPKRADDQQVFQYVSKIHLGSRADLNRIPMDTEFRLVDMPLNRLPANVPAHNLRAQQYAQMKTAFPPIVVAGGVPDGHHRIAAARLRGDKTIRAYVPADMVTKSEANPFSEGNYPSSADDVEIFDYFQTIHLGSRADLKKNVPYDTEYSLVELALEDLVSGVQPANARAIDYSIRKTPYPPIIMKTEGDQPLDGNHRVTAARLRGDKTIRAYVPLVKGEVKLPGKKAKKRELQPEKELPPKDVLDKELEKAKLPMPEVAAHHHVVLPVGSTVDHKVKVIHGNGKEGWVSVGAGQIQSKDGHPISSRNPGGK